MSSCLSSYSPHGAVRILFSFPQLSFLRLWLLVLGLVYFMVLGRLSHFEFSFFRFWKTLCSWDSLWSECSLGLTRQPVWILPRPHSDRVWPCDLSRSLARSLPFSVSGFFSSRRTGPARFLSSQRAPSFVPAPGVGPPRAGQPSRLAEWASASRGPCGRPGLSSRRARGLPPSGAPAERPRGGWPPGPQPRPPPLPGRAEVHSPWCVCGGGGGDLGGPPRGRGRAGPRRRREKGRGAGRAWRS